MPEPVPPYPREPHRVLVTGSRTWRDAARLWSALDAVADQLAGRALVIVHGDADSGADRMARIWVRRRQARGHGEISEDARPADWEGPCRPECRTGHRRARRGGSGSYCPAAGDYRNIEMCESGIHAVLAFLAACSKPRCPKRQPHPSHGTAHCADYAEEAGIRTSRWYDESITAVLDGRMGT